MACKATWQSHASPRGRLRGVDVVQTRDGATRVHADAWVAPHGKRVFGLVGDGPTGIVGPSNRIGAVTQVRKGAPLYICAISFLFLYVRLCST